ncbi:hypothetical protein [Rhodococcus sp. USK13]|uniref:hypothetical protein n=1 Tax=Rhodococcus sp. USK13 TaxID=2806442 RepID=UPI001BCD7B40|nr:hypothetical protein [Rhodococcus sp. USK13]
MGLTPLATIAGLTDTKKRKALSNPVAWLTSLAHNEQLPIPHWDYHTDGLAHAHPDSPPPPTSPAEPPPPPPGPKPPNASSLSPPGKQFAHQLPDHHSIGGLPSGHKDDRNARDHRGADRRHHDPVAVQERTRPTTPPQRR